MNWAGLVLLALYSVLLAAAAAQDFTSLRISNGIVIATLVSAIVLLLFVRDPATPWQHLASFAIMLGAGVVLFSLGWIGGGDAKLMAAAAALFNLTELAGFVIAMALSGAVTTILLLVLRTVWPVTKPPHWLAARKGQAIPYGVAIALGAVATAWYVIPDNAIGS